MASSVRTKYLAKPKHEFSSKCSCDKCVARVKKNREAAAEEAKDSRKK